MNNLCPCMRWDRAGYNVCNVQCEFQCSITESKSSCSSSAKQNQRQLFCKALVLRSLSTRYVKKLIHQFDRFIRYCDQLLSILCSCGHATCLWLFTSSRKNACIDAMILFSVPKSIISSRGHPPEAFTALRKYRPMLSGELFDRVTTSHKSRLLQPSMQLWTWKP